MRALAATTSLTLATLLAVPFAAGAVEPGTSPQRDAELGEQRSDGGRRQGDGASGQPRLMAPPGSRGGNEQRGGNGERPISRLFVQLQQLQQEVMELRGQVEEQQHAIDRLKREQRQRYLDLDRRIAELGAGRLDERPPSEAGERSQADGQSAEADRGGTRSDGADVGSERAAYDRAFELLRDKQYQRAIDAFRRFIDAYSGGEFVPNAYYWLGELYLALSEPDLEASRQAFAQVLQQFPDHRKVPDALYKLGVVYDQLGDPEQARRHLERVRDEYAGTPSAKLARNYLDKLEQS